MRFARNSAKLSVALAALAVLLGLGATRVKADSVTYNVTVPNTALSPYSGTFAQVTVTLTSSTTATVTFNSCGPDGDENCVNSGNLFLLAGNSAADVNVNASSFTVSGISSTNLEAGFTSGPVTSGGSGNVSSFGVFNENLNSFDGFQHSSTTISFTITNNSGTWASAADVLATNGDGYVAAIHGFVCTDSGESTNDCTSVIVTGFAADGGSSSQVPEPGSLMLFGTGLLGMAGFLRRKLMA